jgi:hypothetical protein
MIPGRAYIWYEQASNPPIQAGDFPAWIFLRVHAGFLFKVNDLAAAPGDWRSQYILPEIN